MREPNMCFPSHNKAAVCITSAIYDRRALDCTASLPLINSLTHLAYLTSTSPRIREFLVLDGGLERLVRILSPEYLTPERRNLWKWTLAFQCVVNVGVRGTEQFRTKVVEAGMIPIVLRVLENFLRALELVRQENDRKDTTISNNNNNQPQSSSSSSSLSFSTQHNPYGTTPQQVIDTILSQQRTTEQTPTDSQEPVIATSTQPNVSTIPPIMNISPFNNNNNNLHQSIIPTTDGNHSNLSGHPQSTRQQHRVLRKSTFPYIKMTAAQRRRNRMNKEPTKSVPTWQDPREPNIDNVFYREEDILLSLQLLAYLSKYPHIRNQFHTNYDRNVFSVVERFCHRLHPNPIQYWAGVIMRNACRKDETKGGTRRCANMHCGKWETQPREFAKCRRCRKAKYCCKACQSRAWGDGHRWWCVERHATVPPQDPTATTILAPQQQPTVVEATLTATTQQQELQIDHQVTATTIHAEGTTITRARSTTPTPTGTASQVNHTEQHRPTTATITSTVSSNDTPNTAQNTDINDSNSFQIRFDRVRELEHRRHFRRLLSSPVSTVPTMNPPGHRRTSLSGQHQEQQRLQQEQQQSPSSPIIVNDMTNSSPHGNLSMVEQEHNSNGSTENTDNHNTIIMDVGLQMET
ncbi:hypothetical protein BC941DRAFT_471096 [Chlamydoabsidia padenii]|nr:hypothetical protein BC941DRAFT_471096 [Chlamydoabsidia padenii]